MKGRSNPKREKKKGTFNSAQRESKVHSNTVKRTHQWKDGMYVKIKK